MTGSTRRLLARLIADRSGASAIMIGLAMTAMIGFAGLGTEVGAWYLTKRSMQGAADASVFSAATGYVYGENSTQFRTEAKSVAANYGFVDGTNGVTVTINNPPATGAYTANPLAIEVIIQEPQTRLISSLFLASNPTVKTRAVAIAGAPGNGCVLTLDQAAVDDVFNNGTTNVSLNACDLYINAAGNNALTLTGQAILNITNGGAYIHGGYNGGGTLNDFNQTHFGAPVQPDPFANMGIPSYSGCNDTNTVVTGGVTQSYGAAGTTTVFCNGLSITGNSTVNLASGGIYIIDQGLLNVAGGSTLTGSNVTIFLTSSTGSNYATAQIAGGANVTLSAPTDPTSPYYGMAIYQDRNAPQSSGGNNIDQIVGGTTMNISGVIYFPNQQVVYTGNSNTGASGNCNPIVAFQVEFKGTSAFADSCPGYPGFGQKIGLIPTKLVE